MPKKPQEGAKALQANAAVKRGEQQKKEPEAESLAVPVHFLLAAECIASKIEKGNTHAGVLVHQKDAGYARVVGYQPGIGGRLFVGSFPVGEKPPAWLKQGLLLPRDDLKAKVNVIAKIAGSKFVHVTHRPGEPRAVLQDTYATINIQINVPSQIEEPANYEVSFELETFLDMDEEGANRARKEWEPIGFNSRHLKDAMEIIKVLEASMPKEDRDPVNGIVVRMFNSGKPEAPRVFDFEGVHGAVLVLSGYEVVQPISPPTARILAPATKLTIAAYRAHETRWLDRAKAAPNDRVRAEYQQKAKGFADKVSAIMAMLPDEKPRIAAGPKVVAIAPPQTPAEKAADTRATKEAAKEPEATKEPEPEKKEADNVVPIKSDEPTTVH